jgi:2-hydroxycyclohexanecarboxyl-CoA dehydrogenase
MDLGLGGKTAIVTGGASNIGKAIVEGLFAEGASVVIADVDEKQAGQVVKTLCESGRDEVLFINKPYEEFEREIAINLWGPIHCIKAVAPGMIERSYGKIVNIGSDAGRVGEYNEAVYGACKGGLITLTKALAREFGRHKLNLNVVCPGLTLPENPEDAGVNSLWHADSHQSQIFRNEETMKKVVKHYPLRRAGVPADLVPMVLLLASDKTSYVTGQCISVSGGYAM